jgi:hypothetical protein
VLQPADDAYGEEMHGDRRYTFFKWAHSVSRLLLLLLLLM